MTTITGMLALILQLGITMLVPIVFCTIGGAWLGERVGWLGFPVIGFFLGAAGGMQGAWKLIRRMTADWPESEVSQQALDRAQRSKAGTETAAETQHSKTGTETAAETQHSKAGTETAAETTEGDSR